MGMKRLWGLLLLTACLSARTSFPVPQAEVYSEGIYWPGSSVISNSVFARTFSRSTPVVHPFFQMGIDQTFGDQARGDLYIAPGLHFQKSFFTVFGEHRFHQYTTDLSSNHEWRALLIAGDMILSSLGRENSFLPFWEPYSELLLSTHRDYHISFQGMSRLGIRFLFSPQSSTDLFLEPYLSFLRNTWGELTQFQLRPSARAQFCHDALCLSLVAARFFPMTGERDPGFRFLATLKGTI